MHKIDRIAWILGLALLAAAPVTIWATCTYDTSNESKGSGYTVASCNLTTEAGPTLASEGKSLVGVGGLRVTATASGNMTAAGKLSAYVYSDAGQWTRSAGRDLTISAAANNETWTDIVVTVPRGRIDYRPSGAGSNNVLIYISGSN